MNDHHNNPDTQRILDIGAGDERALEAIYDRYAQRIHSLALSILHDASLAEDAVQEVFSNIWQKAATYRPEMAAPGTWIMSVAHHKIVDYFRARRRVADMLAPPDDEAIQRIPSPSLSVEEQVERGDHARMVREALLELPEEQRRPLYLSAWYGYTQSEIAAMLGWPLGTVKTRMRLGMQKLKAALETYVAA